MTSRSPRRSKTASPLGGFRGSKKHFDEMTYLEPDPILKLKHIIGFGPGIGTPGANLSAFRYAVNLIIHAMVCPNLVR